MVLGLNVCVNAVNAESAQGEAEDGRKAGLHQSFPPVFWHQPIAYIHTAISVGPIIEATCAYQLVLLWQGDAPPDAFAVFQQCVVPAHLLVSRFDAVVRHAIVSDHLWVGKPGKNRIRITAMDPAQRAAGQKELWKLDRKVIHTLLPSLSSEEECLLQGVLEHNIQERLRLIMAGIVQRQSSGHLAMAQYYASAAVVRGPSHALMPRSSFQASPSQRRAAGSGRRP